MSLVRNFNIYCSCYEIPRAYAIWSAVALIGATTMRRVFIRQGDIRHHGNIYVCLVGEQGIKKSTPMSFAKQCFKAGFPKIKTASAVQSREDIVKFMASEDGKHQFTNSDGAVETCSPYPMFINELKNFLSFNPAGMIEFLTDIYDVHFFDAGTIKRGLEEITNPCINILACETPQWITDKLKSAILVGGMARRMVFVIETDAVTSEGDIISIPRPQVTPEAKQALIAVRNHLHKIESISGEFQWDPAAQEMFDEWYHRNKKAALATDSPLLRGYRRTKDAQLLKLCMLLALGEDEPKLLITTDLILQGLAMLDSIEKNLAKLTIATGRNELATGQQMLLDLLERNGGFMPEKILKAKLDSELKPMEQITIIQHLAELGLIHRDIPLKLDGVERKCIITPAFYEELKQKKRKGGESK